MRIFYKENPSGSSVVIEIEKVETKIRPMLKKYTICLFVCFIKEQSTALLHYTPTIFTVIRDKSLSDKYIRYSVL